MNDDDEKQTQMQGPSVGGAAAWDTSDVASQANASAAAKGARRQTRRAARGATKARACTAKCKYAPLLVC